MSQNSKLNGAHLLLAVIGVALVAYLTMSLQNQHLSKPSLPSSKAQLSVEQAYVNVEVPPLSNYIETTERPLFSRSRRPVQAAQPVNNIVTPQQVSQPKKRAPLLIGIIASGGVKTALIRSNKTSELQRVKEQEYIDGWLTMEISQQTVILVGPAGKKQVLDLRDNKLTTTFNRQSNRHSTQAKNLNEMQRRELEKMKRTARSNTVLKAEIKNVVKQ